MAFPGTFNFNYYRGDRYEFNISPQNSDRSTFDLTAYTGKFFIANNRGANATQYEARVEKDGNQIKCIILPEVGRQLSPGTNYVYDVEISKADGAFIYTLLTGNIKVTDDISGSQQNTPEEPEDE
jgi:hypothetical protein